jgi:periplasmic divalent cation tolerance protein
MAPPEYVVVFCTAPAGEAKTIADALISARLVACVNITDVQSIFSWKGSVQNESEQLLIIKTRYSLLDPLIACIRGLHTYEVPEVIALPIVGGSAPYLVWIEGETS